jgi:diguanylate cyclase (GGDEF)-like protein
MKRWASGLRAQLLMLVFVAVIPAFGLIGYDAVSERRDAVAQAERDAAGLVRLAAREHSRLLASARQLLLSLSKLSEIRSPRTAAACHQLLREVHKLHPYYANLGVATTDGSVFCSALPFSRSPNIADRSYFRRALASRGVGVGDYQVGRITHVPSLNVGHAIVDKTGKVQAIVFVALNLRWLNEMTARIDLLPGSTAAVFDSSGTVLAHYPDPKEWVGKSQKGSALVNAIFSRRAAGTTEGPGVDGVDRLYAFAPLPDSALQSVYVSVGIPRAAASAAANRALIHSLIGLLVVVVLGFVAAWFGSGELILRRISALTAAARRIRAGDLTPPANLSQSADELGELGRTFEDMAGALYRIDRAHKTLSESKRLLLRATDELTLLQEVCRIIVMHVGYQVAYIAYAGEDERRLLRPMAHQGFHGGILALRETLADVSWAAGRGPVATTIRTGKPYVAQHLLGDPYFSPWRENALRHGVASLAVFPISIDNNVVGALAIYAAEPNAFEEQELNLLTEAVQDLSFGIALLRARIDQDRAKAVIEHMAHYDRLTGLPNHASFEDHCRRALAQARSFDRLLAAFIVDLNRLRDINDAFGFHHGDLVLKEVSLRLSRVLSPGAFLARMRGDEFAILGNVGDTDGAEKFALQIVEVLDVPFGIGGILIDVNSTVGISMYPQHGQDCAQLMRRADVAMNDAKKSAQRYGFYRREQEEQRAQRLAMIGELRQAIAANQLTLYYQPKIDMRSGEICGVEALVRWNHPQRGILPPDEFVALAEHSGLIKPLTDWVIGSALRQSSIWRQHGLAVPIAVNLSANNLRDPKLIRKTEQVLREFGATTGWLEFEITEGAVMEDPTSALEILKRLREIGMTLFIDDFGTGYSSLGYLKKLPVHSVKIDKSFVIDMIDDQDSEAIVRTTINLGHELGLAVVAEGVETRTALDRLGGLGCDAAQGYFIGKPMPGPDLQDWIARGTWRLGGTVEGYDTPGTTLRAAPTHSTSRHVGKRR